MDNTAKSISEFLLERLKQTAALEQAADEPKALVDFPLELLLGAEVPPGLRPKAESPPNRKAAQQAYAQITGADHRPTEAEQP